MSDDDLRKAYRARRADASAPPPTPEALERLVAREGSDEQRLDTLDRALSTPEGARELELLRAISHAAREDASRRWWRAPILLATAASLLLVAVGVLSRRTRGPDETRATPVDGAPVLVQPVTDARVAAPVRFVWQAVPGARAYRFELLTDAGTLAASIDTPDTTTRYSGGQRADGDSTYRWVVVALFPEGGEVASRPRRLTIAAP
jgi:hypothetical protein